MSISLLAPLSVGLDKNIGGMIDRALDAAMERVQRRGEREPTEEAKREALLAQVYVDPKAQLDPQALAQATRAGLVERTGTETRITPLGQYVLGADPIE